MSGLNVPVHYVQQYATNIQLLLQQKVSRLRALVSSKSDYVGKQASPVDQVGAIEMREVVDRFSPIGRVDSPLDRRWVFPLDSDLPQLIDQFDKLRLLIDPQSTYVMNAHAAANRKMDDRIINAFFDDAKTGENGGTTTAFPAGQAVAVNHGAAGNTGLTVAKLREAKRILMANEVDLETDPISVAVTAKQHDNLLAEAQVISLDFNDQPVLKEGKIERFLGFNFVNTERLKVDGNSYRRVPVWAKSGMHLGIWKDMTTDVDRRKDLTGHPWQIYVYLTSGATRLEEKKVVEIKCAE